MSPKDAEGMANSVDPDQRSSLIWVYTVCSDLSVRKLRIITVFLLLFAEKFPGQSCSGDQECTESSQCVNNVCQCPSNTYSDGQTCLPSMFLFYI